MSKRQRSNNKRFRRRTLLRGIGAAGILSPFLPMLEATASAGDTTAPRIFNFFFPHGNPRSKFFPADGTPHGASSFAMPPTLAPMERHRDQMCIIDGLANIVPRVGTDNHVEGPAAFATCSGLSDELIFFRDYPDSAQQEDFYYGWNQGASWDYELQRFQAGTSPIDILYAGVHCRNNHPGKRTLFNDTGAEDPIVDPQELYERLFAGAGIPESDLARIRSERRSVIDLVRGELDTLRPRVSVSDHRKIDQHLDAIRTIELSLEQMGPMCTPPEEGPELDWRANDQTPELYDRQLELLAVAAACDLSRVFNFQMSRASTDGLVYDRWLPLASGKEHHLRSHDRTPEAEDDLMQIWRFYFDGLARFIDLLKATPEGDGNVFDNSIIVTTTEIRRGWDHRMDAGFPITVSGGAGGHLQGGRYLNYQDREHNRLLVSLMRQGGMEIDTFGDDVGSGELEDLFS